MLCVNDFEEHARKHLNPPTWIFYSMGAEKEETLRENIRSFTRYHLVPRMLRNAPARDLSVTVLGEKLPIPFGVAPTAYQKMAHPGGESAAAEAASEVGSIYTLSTISTTPLEDVARAVGGASPLWMQVYILKDREHSEEMIKKAETCGYRALVLTVDCPVKGLQYRSWRDPLKLPPHIVPSNLENAMRKNLNYSKDERAYADNLCSTLTWEDVIWLKGFSRLPIVLKGIMTVEDAVQAADLGVAAVWVSNHGGRNLDGIEATIDVLPGISAALSGTGCEVYVDGGVRWGSDIMKALALGANYVFVGRPALWGLAHSGKDGVRKVLEILKSELDRAMHLAGCKDIKDIGPHMVKKINYSRL